jgi:hypothetical protein
MLFYRVNPTFMKGIAPEDPADSKHRPSQKTIFIDSIDRILRTGWRKPAA